MIVGLPKHIVFTKLAMCYIFGNYSDEYLLSDTKGFASRVKLTIPKLLLSDPNKSLLSSGYARLILFMK